MVLNCFEVVSLAHAEEVDPQSVSTLWRGSASWSLPLKLLPLFLLLIPHLHTLFLSFPFHCLSLSLCLSFSFSSRPVWGFSLPTCSPPPLKSPRGAEPHSELLSDFSSPLLTLLFLSRWKWCQQGFLFFCFPVMTSSLVLCALWSNLFKSVIKSLRLVKYRLRVYGLNGKKTERKQVDLWWESVLWNTSEVWGDFFSWS